MSFEEYQIGIQVAAENEAAVRELIARGEIQGTVVREKGFGGAEDVITILAVVAVSGIHSLTKIVIERIKQNSRVTLKCKDFEIKNIAAKDIPAAVQSMSEHLRAGHGHR
jgi:hypothetical protein